MMISELSWSGLGWHESLVVQVKIATKEESL
jgi:hypothetical protein